MKAWLKVGLIGLIIILLIAVGFLVLYFFSEVNTFEKLPIKQSRKVNFSEIIHNESALEEIVILGDIGDYKYSSHKLVDLSEADKPRNDIGGIYIIYTLHGKDRGIFSLYIFEDPMLLQISFNELLENNKGRMHKEIINGVEVYKSKRPELNTNAVYTIWRKDNTWFHLVESNNSNDIFKAYFKKFN